MVHVCQGLFGSDRASFFVVIVLMVLNVPIVLTSAVIDIFFTLIDRSPYKIIKVEGK